VANTTEMKKRVKSFRQEAQGYGELLPEFDALGRSEIKRGLFLVKF